MVKEKVTLSIDKDVLENSKKHIPNISKFVEECLKQYLGYANGTYPTAKHSDILHEIGMLQAKLYIMNENYDAQESMQRIEKHKINSAFWKLWHDYRKTAILNNELLNPFLELVNIDAETIEDILDYMIYYNYVLNPDWEETYKKYLEEEGL